SGICAGIMGLAMAFVLNEKLSPFLKFSSNVVLTYEKRNELILFSAILSAVVLIVTFALTIYFTSRKAKKKGLPVWDSPAKRMIINLFIPLLCGGLFCLLLVYQHYDFL